MERFIYLYTDCNLTLKSTLQNITYYKLTETYNKLPHNIIIFKYSSKERKLLKQLRMPQRKRSNN